MDRPEEGIQCLRGLLHDDVTSIEGEHFTPTEARNETRPVHCATVGRDLCDDAAGADRVNIALRSPFDLEALERLTVRLHLS